MNHQTIPALYMSNNPNMSNKEHICKMYNDDAKDLIEEYIKHHEDYEDFIILPESCQSTFNYHTYDYITKLIIRCPTCKETHIKEIYFAILETSIDDYIEEYQE